MVWQPIGVVDVLVVVGEELLEIGTELCNVITEGSVRLRSRVLRHQVVEVGDLDQ